jgi:hypothetical protein
MLQKGVQKANSELEQPEKLREDFVGGEVTARRREIIC